MVSLSLNTHRVHSCVLEVMICLSLRFTWKNNFTFSSHLVIVCFLLQDGRGGRSGCDVSAAEQAAIQRELELCRECTPVKLRHRDIKGRLRALQERRCARPGGSGWRNSYICSLAPAKSGVKHIHPWSELWVNGTLPIGGRGVSCSQHFKIADSGRMTQLITN